ncbi:phosphate ABC transporter permease subunit PstC [Enterocloster clostridioformis]|uniref:phosphate ABC transporter permease subunit PstC n=1 Tax=Enterocloster clostridioformis TaxID=1531 RepID=UPI00080C694F|nr:phosphate ABC transporter permease subunit PstC [Enterocloster clostridioformis]ANU46105.1 phosphate ABC transporter permease subunit PstC [Lachnoclostridium sp. YL32]NDO30030.1 phosphate ABC transporter permease subunit PstC [Enterocloster clostridioformis]OXE67399.1 phosphate ABC transporter permease subunit PstC [Enterocloster clostridioformis]QQQ99146.1 phosphate ABC transporter permease subunit PstC [Enterocloster clostridioformis]
MNKQLNALFSVLIRALTALTVMVLAFVIYFIVKEALPTFDEVAVPDFLLGQRWMPIACTGEPSFGIFNFIAATLYVSLVAMVLAVTVGLGAAIYLSCAATERMRGILYPFVDLLAGIPSVIYGFMGLTLMVKLFIRAGVHTGSCVLAAGILLAVMLLPFLISSCSETMLKVRKRYQPAADVLGISKWHMVATIVLPGSWKNILLSMILAIGRAMGETMAVMMVIGNANLFPSLLGKSESIASVIALEMGTAVVGSTHYHALYAAGLVLMLLLFLINSVITLLRGRLEQ